MRTLVIGFSRPKNKTLPIGSWLIRLYQRTRYSHVYMRFYSESIERDCIYESAGGRGVSFVGNVYAEQHLLEVESFKLFVSNEGFKKLIQHCMDNSGIGYGFLQNIGIILADLFNLSKNPFRKGKNCSEAIAELLELEGYVLPKDPNLMTPKDIYDLLSR